MALEISKKPVVLSTPHKADARTDVKREDLLRPLPRLSIASLAVATLIIGIYVWGVQGTNAQPGELIRGIPNIVNFFVRLMPPQFDLQPVADLPVAVRLPFTIAGTSVEELADEVPIDPNETMPDWYKQASEEATQPASAVPADGASTDELSPVIDSSAPPDTAIAEALPAQKPWFSWQPSTINKIWLPAVIPSVIQTLQMAIIGSTLSIILAIPFGLLAARNISPHPALYQVTRFFMNIIRAVPELIIALVFVAAVGLGPFGGVLALGLAAIGSIARLYAESIEQIDPQQVMAVRATGAKGLQVFRFSIIPQIMPLVTSYSLSLFEHNLRAASILGLVGAGGVGFLLSKYMALFEYQKLMGAVIVLVLTVTVVDRLSARLRKAII